jgi:uncharacterized protein YbcI
LQHTLQDGSRLWLKLVSSNWGEQAIVGFNNVASSYEPVLCRHNEDINAVGQARVQTIAQTPEQRAIVHINRSSVIHGALAL